MKDDSFSSLDQFLNRYELTILSSHLKKRGMVLPADLSFFYFRCHDLIPHIHEDKVSDFLTAFQITDKEILRRFLLLLHWESDYFYHP